VEKKTAKKKGREAWKCVFLDMVEIKKKHVNMMRRGKNKPLGNMVTQQWDNHKKKPRQKGNVYVMQRRKFSGLGNLRGGKVYSKKRPLVGHI